MTPPCAERTMRWYLPVIVLVLLACEGATNPLCGCSQEVPGAILVGTLSTASGAPVSGYRLRAQVGPKSCDGALPSVFGTAVTDSAGRFGMTMYGAAMDSVCVRLFARDTTPGTSELEAGPLVRHAFRWYPYDTVSADLRLPP